MPADNIEIKVTKFTGSSRNESIVALLIFSLLPIYFIAQTVKNWSHWRIGPSTVVLALCIAYFIGLIVYGVNNLLDTKVFLQIDSTGINTRKYGQVSWASIYDIETGSAPGPRMEFYKIKYWLTDTTTVHTIRFTSDISCKFDDIIDVLSHYTIQNNIRLTT